MKKLIKRRDAGEIVITVGDRDKRLCVSSVKSYREQGAAHIRGAKKVWWPEIRPAQKLTNAVARNFSNVIFVGGNLTENSVKRTFEKYSTTACILPTLKLAPKYHKPLLPDGNPQT